MRITVLTNFFQEQLATHLKDQLSVLLGHSSFYASKELYSMELASVQDYHFSTSSKNDHQSTINISRIFEYFQFLIILIFNIMTAKKKDDSDFQLKIVLVGDSGVGKSNIISKFTKNEFNLQSKTTIGVEFASKVVTIQQKSIKVQIWDTAGQQRYRSMASAYYRGAVGALMVYDITRASSFQNLDKWLKELRNYGTEDIVCLMVGNKSDLKQYRSLKYEHGEDYARKNSMMFMETSALQGHNIEEAFNTMIKQIVNRQKIPTDKKDKSNTKREVLQVTKLSSQQQKKKKCCNS